MAEIGKFELKNIIRKFVIGSPLEPVIRFLFNKPKVEFDNSTNYWDRRYKVGGNSGAGSYGRLAQFKAEIINDFVSRNKIDNVIEFGCGDGNQLAQSNYQNYLGVDVSQTSVDVCKKMFSADSTKKFIVVSKYKNQLADLVLSLDVIYHLIEDDVYHSYMSTLFSAAQRSVIVYSSNFEDGNGSYTHVKHRKFTDWVEANAQGFKLVEHIRNKYPYDERDPENTSFADFYVFQKQVK